MKVGEIMTPNVISVTEDSPVRDVARVLDRHRISGLPVCDGDGHMVGLVSEYDLIAKPDAHTAGQAMTRDVISVMEDTSVDEVRFLLVNRKIKRVPVLRGLKLVVDCAHGANYRVGTRVFQHNWHVEVPRQGNTLPDGKRESRVEHLRSLLFGFWNPYESGEKSTRTAADSTATPPPAHHPPPSA